ncbi:WhiB family transcriptional regulator [Nocardia sp. XZ_19_369]|uniref:WhiB family transcriptional regulator n=1 Tax=Nocardia sp. XZ_19_369 TaxID=2769487 RepID=UPI00188F1877|nr:WhiB family transcriptional regulator [Nocardia sp. XZ_19_369]
MSSYDWQEYAACRSVHPEVFFPLSHTRPGTRPIPADRDTPRRICDGCSVRLNCARLGLDTFQRRWRHGFYAGIDLQDDDARTRLLDVIDTLTDRPMASTKTGGGCPHPSRGSARR